MAQIGIKKFLKIFSFIIQLKFNVNIMVFLRILPIKLKKFFFVEINLKIFFMPFWAIVKLFSAKNNLFQQKKFIQFYR